MPRVYAVQQSNRVRRADREITDEGWIRDFSHRAPMAALAMASAEGQPFINSKPFAYDEATNSSWCAITRILKCRKVTFWAWIRRKRSVK